MLTEKITSRTKQRLLLSVITLIFALPFGASWFIYNFTDIGKGDVAGSYGELIVPPVPVADIELLATANGAETGHLHGKWSLVYIAGTDCDPPCRSRLDDMMGLRMNLGKDTARLQLLVGTLSAGSEPPLRQFLQDYAGDRVLFLPGTNMTVSMQEYALEAGRLYLVDPLGNIMMRYSSASDPEGIMRDLKRLLRYSRIG
jgi:cytochrome oxidase Cu insertion factor (SCO1/SenC/PrrC family)